MPTLDEYRLAVRHLHPTVGCMIAEVDGLPAFLKWKGPGDPPTFPELEAALPAAQAAQAEKDARPGNVIARKGQGNSIPDLVARLDELVQTLQDKGVL